jgi:hypothetical protein
MALSQYVSVSLSLLGLVGLTGAGVAVGKLSENDGLFSATIRRRISSHSSFSSFPHTHTGSGIGMMSYEALSAEEKVTAASPLEKSSKE